ncbi:MAG: transglycosylase SLT domain-containing protein [Acidobacteriota bacterium]
MAASQAARVARSLRKTIKQNNESGLGKNIVLCQSAIESSSNPEQIGFQGEVGLFQIKPSTANSLGLGTFTVAQLKDPATNTQLSTRHLKQSAQRVQRRCSHGIGRIQARRDQR